MLGEHYYGERGGRDLRGQQTPWIMPPSEPAVPPHSLRFAWCEPNTVL